MSDTSLLDAYMNALLIQYTGKPKASATIRAMVSQIVMADLAISVRDGYNLLTAIGKQLDVLGKYAGISRAVTGFNANISYFGYLVYGQTPPKTGITGYVLYGATGIVNQYRKYAQNDTTLFLMTDDQYRAMITLRFYKNRSNGSMASVDFILAAVFGTRYLVFDGGMRVVYFFNASDTLLVTIAKFTMILPKPTGVGYEIHYVGDTSKLFGYRQYGVTPLPYIVGYSLYGVTPVGGMASYG